MWHGFATRDSHRRGFCITPSVVKQCFKRIFKHFSYCPGDATRSVQWVMIQDKPGRVLRSFVLDHSWTPFNQRLFDSRNCCRTREEPLKPCQEIIFSGTLFFSMETNWSKAFRNTAGPRNMHMSRMSTVLTEATILSLGIVAKLPLTTTTSTAKKVILFWLTSSVKSL